ncbi:DsrE family protein [Aequoribacter sp.]|uniref:DsrE family protein n=1 Tax=Aequoribacter sp. TaxID=2847771 RepID=UPI003F69D854
MTHAILIASHPGSTTYQHAEAFCAALAQRAEIRVIYFVGEAVEVTQPQHSGILSRWLNIARDHEVPLWVCSGSMSALPNCDIPPEIEIAGHASWVEASLSAAKIVSFPA